jgi:hypothetical protein
MGATVYDHLVVKSIGLIHEGSLNQSLEVSIKNIHFIYDSEF